MAAKIYWYPIDGNGAVSATRQEISISTSVIADFNEYPIRDVQTQWPADSRPLTTNLGAKSAVQITIRLQDEGNDADIDLYCALRSLESHLLLGGWIGFAHNSEYAGIWPVVNTLGTDYIMPAQGDDSGFYGDELLGWETTITPHNRDSTNIVVFETDGPESQINYSRITTWALGSWEIPQVGSGGYGLFFNSVMTKCIIRNRWFWPYLYLSDEGRNKEMCLRKKTTAGVYELTLDLLYCPRELFDLLGDTP